MPHYLSLLMLSTKDAELNQTQKLPSGSSHSMGRLTDANNINKNTACSRCGNNAKEEEVKSCE